MGLTLNNELCLCTITNHMGLSIKKETYRSSWYGHLFSGCI